MLSRTGARRNLLTFSPAICSKLLVITVGYSYFNTGFKFIDLQIIEVSASERSLNSLTGL